MPLYGLKHSLRQWNIELSSCLQIFGFQQSTFDPFLLIKRSSSSFMALLVYVGVLLNDSLPSNLHLVKAFLHKVMGIARYFLCVELTYGTDGLHLHQHKYICDLLHDVGLLGACPSTTPFPNGHRFTVDYSPLLTDPAPYRCLIGQLLYLNFN